MKKTAFILFFILTQTVFAQVEFTAKLNRTEIGFNETVWIEFIMNVEDYDDFKIDAFEGFISKTETPTQRITRSILNGVESLEKGYTYVLEPTEIGTFYIGTATMLKDGKEYKTEPLKITVTDFVKNTDQPSVDVEVHFIAEANRTEVYEKELFTVNYKLLFDKEIDVNRLISKGFIGYKDFFSELPYYPNTEVKREEEIYNGKTYLKIEVGKMYLFPKESGNLTLSSLEFDIELLIPNGKKNFFGTTDFDKVIKNIKANPISIVSKPLPEERKPESFNGVVGNYNFSQTISKTHLKLEETFDIEVIVEGTGNQLVFSIPKPNVSEGLEIIEIKKEDTVFLNDKPEYLFKVIYTIKPKYAGEHSVNKITYAYFDPVIEDYIYDTKYEQTITVID